MSFSLSNAINNGVSALIQRLISLFAYFLKPINNGILFIRTHFHYVKNFLNEYQLYIIVGITLFVLAKIFKFGFKYRSNLSKFLMYPEPLVRGIWLNIFNGFNKSNLSDVLLELEKLISTLPTSTGIILVLGPVDYMKDITTSFKGEEASWFYIRGNIYVYIHSIEKVKYITGFLNRVKPEKPINSVILKLSFAPEQLASTIDNTSLIRESIKDISVITGIKAPLYVDIYSIPWLEENSIYFRNESYIGFLFDGYDTIGTPNVLRNFDNLKLILLDKMLAKQAYQSKFFSAFEEQIQTITQYLIYLTQLDSNLIRGLFFTTDREKAQLKQLRLVGDGEETLFLNFHKEVIEKELFIGDLIEDSLVPRYMKYKIRFFITYILLLVFMIVRINQQMWLFNNKFMEAKGKMQQVLDQGNNKSGYQIYELIKALNRVDLSGVNYVLLPHNYLIGTLYESFCETEEILTLTLIQKQMDGMNIVQNADQDDAFEQFNLFIKKILDMENIIFNNQQIKRFGVSKQRKKSNFNKKSQMFLEQSFDKVRLIYFLLLDNFLNSYYSDQLERQLRDFQANLIYILKGERVTIEHLRNLVETYNDINNYLTMQHAQSPMQKLGPVNVRIGQSVIFGPEVAQQTLDKMILMEKTNNSKLMTYKNNLTGSFLIFNENKQLILSAKVVVIIKDLEQFLNEPFMGDSKGDGPIIPNKGLISSWNTTLLSETVKNRNQATEFQKNLNSYIPELRNVLFVIFKKQISGAIFNKIGISQTIMPKEYINLQNTLEAFNYMNALLDFFLEAGNTDYYYQILNIFLNDFKVIDAYVEHILGDTIFFQYKNIDELKRDNLLEFLFFTNKQEQIREILNDDTDKFIKVFHNYIEPIYNILNYDHFAKFRATQYIKYRSIALDVQKYDKGISNSFNKFTDFVMNRLINYSIYDAFKEEIFEYDSTSEIYLLTLLNNLKKGIITKSQQLYNQELLFSYHNLQDEFRVFANKFPINNIFDKSNFLSIEEFFNFLQKNKKNIALFKNKNNIGIAMEKMHSLCKNIKKDGSGYYFQPTLTLNTPDKYAIHSAYVGLININQTKEYSPYLVQQDTKLYFHLPVYLHVEVVESPVLKIQKISSDYYSTEINSRGICFCFPTIWHFLNFVYQHREYGDDISKIQILVAIPVKIENRIHSIKFNILFNHFVFFPGKLLALENDE